MALSAAINWSLDCKWSLPGPPDKSHSCLPDICLTLIYPIYYIFYEYSVLQLVTIILRGLRVVTHTWQADWNLLGFSLTPTMRTFSVAQGDSKSFWSHYSTLYVGFFFKIHLPYYLPNFLKLSYYTPLDLTEPFQDTYALKFRPLVYPYPLLLGTVLLFWKYPFSSPPLTFTRILLRVLELFSSYDII